MATAFQADAFQQSAFQIETEAVASRIKVITAAPMRRNGIVMSVRQPLYVSASVKRSGRSGPIEVKP